MIRLFWKTLIFFTEWLKSSEYVSIPFNGLQNQEQKVKIIKEVTKTTPGSQIKGTEQLAELQKFVAFINIKLIENIRKTGEKKNEK